MSLFTQLQRLYRRDKFLLEDFHTEIVAQVLRDFPALTLEWLRSIGATKLLNPEIVGIVTQEEFPALAGHATDSRPDIAIRLAEGDTNELILIESKVDAKEGPEQLKRYSEHLYAKTEIQHTALVFITRNFEPDRSDDFELDRELNPGSEKFSFHQTRWFKFYQQLKSHTDHGGLVSHLIQFMEENGMSVRNQFKSVDCTALENFHAAKSLMDETLWSDVAAEFEARFGRVSSMRKAMNQLGDNGRYVMYAHLGATRDLECTLGYWIQDEDPIWVGMMLFHNPKSPKAKQILAAFKGFAKSRSGSWETDGLDNEKEPGTVFKGTGIPTFFNQSDHIQSIKNYFLELLSEVKEFQAKYPALPWTSNTSDADQD